MFVCVFVFVCERLYIYIYIYIYILILVFYVCIFFNILNTNSYSTFATLRREKSM